VSAAIEGASSRVSSSSSSSRVSIDARRPGGYARARAVGWVFVGDDGDEE
jgi:hypothetical protein